MNISSSNQNGKHFAELKINIGYLEWDGKDYAHVLTSMCEPFIFYLFFSSATVVVNVVVVFGFQWMNG